MAQLKWILTIVAISVFSLVGCMSKDQLKKTIEENPEIVFNAIEKNPGKFIEVVNKAAREAQKGARERQIKQAQEQLEEEFKNPKKPEIKEDRAIFGAKNAPVTIVEYSDFECPYCKKGYETVNQVLEEYGDKVRVIYKHLPLDFHPLAMPASQYYEAIALQDAGKAKKFHDKIFQDQVGLKKGKVDFLKKTAKSLGVDMAKLKKDLDSEEVMARINADKAEAQKFGFSGTPGFLINGVSLKGAYPFPKFKEIIDRHLSGK